MNWVDRALPGISDFSVAGRGGAVRALATAVYSPDRNWRRKPNGLFAGAHRRAPRHALVKISQPQPVIMIGKGIMMAFRNLGMRAVV
ncbi:hypothetical protein ACEYYB_12020 [Paracoccus sp. p4-l81]